MERSGDRCGVSGDERRAARIRAVDRISGSSAGEDKEGEGVSSGETPDSEKARAMELRKLGHDPSSSLDDVVTGDIERGDEGWG